MVDSTDKIRGLFSAVALARLLDFAAFLVVSFAVLLMTGSLVFRLLNDGRQERDDARLSSVEFQKLVEGAEQIGIDNAPVLVVVFSDYGCSFAGN